MENQTGSKREILSMDLVSKTFPNGTRALEDFSLKLFDGEIVALLGKNGSGKTTVFKLLSGLTLQDAGQISVNGERRFSRFKNHVSLLLADNRNLYWKLTVRENIGFLMSLRKFNSRENRAKALGLLERFDLAGKADTLVQELSRGMQQKLSLLLAVLDPAPILLLDEPTLGLDVQSRDELMNLIMAFVKAEGKSAVIASHDLDFVSKICSRFYFADEGKNIASFDSRTIDQVIEFKHMSLILEREAAEAKRRELSALGFSLREVDEGLLLELPVVNGSTIAGKIREVEALGLDIRSLQYERPAFDYIMKEIKRIAGGEPA